MKTMFKHEIQHQQPIRDALNAAVEEFLARGGQIEQLAYGEGSPHIPYLVYARRQRAANDNNETMQRKSRFDTVRI